MDNRIANDMISSGMIPSGEKKKEDLGRTQYGSAPSPNKLMDAYKSMYDKKEEVINEMKMGDVSGSADFASRNIKGAKGAAIPPAKKEPSNPVDAKRERLKKIMADNESVDLLAAYRSIYEHHKKDADGNTIPHEDEEVSEGKIPAGLQAYLDKKKGKKEDKKDMKEDVDLFDIVSDIFVAEGYEEKDVYKVMSQLTEEQLNEIAVTGTIATLGAGLLKGMLGAGKVAAAAGKGLASAGKAAAVKGMTAAKTAAKGIASTAKTGMSKASDALGKVSNIAKGKAKGMGDTMTNMGKSVGDEVKNEIKRKVLQGNDGGSNKITKTGTMSAGSYQAASADLFDIVKGQLLDEGLSEEEIKDIMLTLTPDEILNEISVGKMGDYISAASKDVQKTASSIDKDSASGKKIMSDDPRIDKMSKRTKSMAMAGTKIAKKLTPPPLPKMEEYKGSGTPEQQAAMKAQVEVSKKVNRYGGKTPSGTTAVDAKKGIEDVRKSM